MTSLQQTSRQKYKTSYRFEDALVSQIITHKYEMILEYIPLATSHFS